MERLTVRWEFVPQDPQRVVYYVDDVAVGEDNSGFDKVLEAVRAHKNRGVTLKIGNTISLGGGRWLDRLPFRERVNELTEAAGEDNLIYDF